MPCRVAPAAVMDPRANLSEAHFVGPRAPPRPAPEPASLKRPAFGRRAPRAPPVGVDECRGLLRHNAPLWRAEGVPGEAHEKRQPAKGSHRRECDEEGAHCAPTGVLSWSISRRAEPSLALITRIVRRQHEHECSALATQQWRPVCAFSIRAGLLAEEWKIK